MKTSELKKIVEDNGYRLFIDNSYKVVLVKLFNANVDVATVNQVEYGNYSLHSVIKQVAQAIIDYAYTPLEEREEEKKYYLMFPKGFEFCSYLTFDTKNKIYTRSLSENVYGIYKNKFTQKEIDAMPFDTNFFIKEEVK